MGTGFQTTAQGPLSTLSGTLLQSHVGHMNIWRYHSGSPPGPPAAPGMETLEVSEPKPSDLPLGTGFCKWREVGGSIKRPQSRGSQDSQGQAAPSWWGLGSRELALSVSGVVGIR